MSIRQICKSLGLGVLLLALTGCSSLSRVSLPCADDAAAADPSAPGSSPAGDSWVYQLQSAIPAELASSAYDIAVIDYSLDGTADGEYSQADLQEIRAGGPQTVLAYFSIGEAEEYRYYFDPEWTHWLTGQPDEDAPCWLGRTNPEWRGNYKVQYWSSGWQDIVLAYLDRIIEAGFDGVYLDIIDGYEYWADPDNGEGFRLTENDAAERMINLVLTISGHARAVDPDFMVLPQNGAPILQFDSLSQPAGAYLEAISGIGIEDLYYDETRPKDETEIPERLSFIEVIRDAGKIVLVVDYVDDGGSSDSNLARIESFRERALEDGLVPYVGIRDRELDEIN